MLSFYLFQISCVLFLFLFHSPIVKAHIHVLINSMKGHSISINNLMESFKLSCGAHFSSIQFWIVYGGYYDLENYRVNISGNVIEIKAYHNSIDFTAFIAVVELFQYPDLLRALPQRLNADDMFFYMHDTSEVGPRFCALLLEEWSHKVNEEQFMTARITNYPSMNIGLYRLSYLLKYQDFLVRGTINTNVSHVDYYKTKGMHWEDWLFRLDSNCQMLAQNRTLSGPSDVYGTGVLRRMEYFPAIDFYKFKANWDYIPGEVFQLRE